MRARGGGGFKADVSAILASPMASVAPMVTCAGCGAPEVHTPHRILEVRRGGIVVRFACMSSSEHPVSFPFLLITRTIVCPLRWLCCAWAVTGW